MAEIIKTLGTVAEYINGRAFKPDEWEKIGKPIIRIQNLTHSSEVCNRTTKDFDKKFLITKGDLLFSWSATLGAFIWCGEDAWLNQHIFKVISNDDVEKLYLYYYLKFIIGKLQEKTHGSGMVHITLKPFKETEIPLPPIDEQKRIVAVIESLFEKLDAAKSIVQKILDGYELRRAVILHKAFTGELTNKKPPIVPISEILEKIFIGPFGTMLHKEEYISGGIPVINPKHISNQKIFPQTTVTISSKKAKVLSSYRLLENDIIMGRRGEMGRTAPVTEKEVGWICGTGSLVLRPPKTILAKFYSQILASQFCIQYLENVSVGSTMKNLNERVIRNMPVPFFKLDEQKEIVRVLDSLLDKENRTKEIAEKILLEIDLLKRTILARAFRGELGTNNPSENINSLAVIK